MGRMKAIDEILPLSPVQQGILFDVIKGDLASGAYVVVIRAALEGDIDVVRFRDAFEQEVRARDVLNASFVWENIKQPVQVLQSAVRLPFEHLDLRSDQDADARIDTLVETERHTPFDLTKAPLMRLTLVQIAPERYELVWTVHHLIGDGWSTGILLDAVQKRYANANSQTDKPPQYRDYLVWLKRYDRTSDIAFWKKTLADAPGPTAIEQTGKIDPQRGYHSCYASLDAETLRALRAFATSYRATLATVVNLAWALILRRYSGEDEVAFALTTSGRPPNMSRALEAVGPFVNTLPLPVSIDPDQSVASSIEALSQTMNARRAHEMLPLADVIAHTGYCRDRDAIESLVAFEDVPATSAQGVGFEVASQTVYSAGSNPLALLITPADTFGAELLYDAGRYDAAFVENLLSDFISVLAGMVHGAALSVRDLMQAQLGKSDTTELAPFTMDALPHDQILAFSRTTPDVIALSFEGQDVRYRDLDERSAQLAAGLQHKGVGSGDIVPIALDRGADFIIAMLAVLRIGAAYCPIDLTYPKGRRDVILEACGAKLVISSSRCDFETEMCPIFDIADATPSDVALRDVAIDPSDVAYVIFTSGSTGTPKGVPVTHSNLAYSTSSRAGLYDRAPSRFLVLSSFAFDSSVVGIYWTLASGGTLVISPQDGVRDPARLGQLIYDQKVTHMLLLGSLHHSLLSTISPERLVSLETVIVAGEAIGVHLPELHFDVIPKTRLYNEYGPTEATVWCSAYEIKDAAPKAGGIPIGQAPEGTALSVGDIDRVELPAGALGALYVTGPGVVRGYLDETASANQAFEHSSGLYPTYSTGDLATRDQSGDFHFVGRTDAQLKIRGYRVDVSEIEGAASTLEDVSKAVVVDYKTSNGLGLALLVIPADASADAEQIRDDLASMLPVFMLPQKVLFREAFPMLPNGKIDIGTLRTSLSLARDEAEYEAPIGYAEEQLAKLWAQILNVETVGRSDNFFDLGGHSLTAIRMMSEARKLGISIAPFQVFESPVLKDLALRLSQIDASGVEHDQETLFASTEAVAGTPSFLMIHGSNEMYAYLAHQFADQRRLGFAFSHFSGGTLLPDETIEGMARATIQQLKKMQSSGPYHLGGYSLGGLIALEMARQLRDAGEEIETLFLLDPSYMARMPEAEMDHGTQSSGPSRLLRQTALRVQRRYYAAAQKTGFGDTEYQRRSQVVKTYAMILDRYRPPIYDGVAEVIIAREAKAHLAGNDWLSRAVPHANVRELDCNHAELQKSPKALFEWTTRLTKILNAADAR